MPQAREKLFSTFAEALSPVDEQDGPHKGLRRYQIAKVGPVKRLFGTINITKKHFTEVVKNFQANAAGVTHPRTGKPAVHWDYSHIAEGKAAGWIHDVETDGTALFAWTAWTPKAEQALSDGEFIGASMEIDFAYVDNEGKDWGAVLFGSALTNIPAIKDMDPVALQEQATKQKENDMKDLLDKLKAASAEERVTLLNELLKLCGMEGLVEQSAATKTELSTLKLELAKGGDAALKAEVVRLSAELATANTKLTTQGKETAFADLLTKGLAVPAQKDSFMSGDMAAFAALSEVKAKVNLNAENGTGAENAGAVAAKDKAEAGTKIVALADAFALAQKVSFKDAVAHVRRDPANAALVKLADA